MSDGINDSYNGRMPGFPIDRTSELEGTVDAQKQQAPSQHRGCDDSSGQTKINAPQCAAPSQQDADVVQRVKDAFCFATEGLEGQTPTMSVSHFDLRIKDAIKEARRGWVPEEQIINPPTQTSEEAGN